MGDKYQIMTPEIEKKLCLLCKRNFKEKIQNLFHISVINWNVISALLLDIFPFDCIAPEKKQARKQQMITLFLDRLIYLCGSAHPIIPYTGIKYYMAAGICWCVHYIAKIMHFSPRFIYRLFVKQCTKYNMIDTDVVTSFGDGSSLKYRSTVRKMFPLKKVEFENMTIEVMDNVDEHLKRTYGDYMKLPPIDQRVNHAPYIIDFGDIYK